MITNWVLNFKKDNVLELIAKISNYIKNINLEIYKEFLYQLFAVVLLIVVLNMLLGILLFILTFTLGFATSAVLYYLFNSKTSILEIRLKGEK